MGLPHVTDDKFNLESYKTGEKTFIFLCYLCKKIIVMIVNSLNKPRVVLAEQNKTNRWLAEQIVKSDITTSRWIQNRK